MKSFTLNFSNQIKVSVNDDENDAHYNGHWEGITDQEGDALYFKVFWVYNLFANIKESSAVK